MEAAWGELETKSEFKIQNFWILFPLNFCLRFEFAPGSPISHYLDATWVYEIDVVQECNLRNIVSSFCQRLCHILEKCLKASYVAAISPLQKITFLKEVNTSRTIKLSLSP